MIKCLSSGKVTFRTVVHHITSALGYVMLATCAEHMHLSLTTEFMGQNLLRSYL